MSLGCPFFYDGNPAKVVIHRWSHNSTFSLNTSDLAPRSWTKVVQFSMHSRMATLSLPHSTFPKISKRNRIPTDHGSFGFGCGVRAPEDAPPSGCGAFAQDMPIKSVERREKHGYRNWQREHLLLTSQHLPDRVPLPDKGKPVVRRGRKATDQISDLTAGLPEEE